MRAAIKIVRAAQVVGAHQLNRVQTLERMLDFCDRIVLAAFNVDQAGVPVGRATAKEFALFSRGAT